MNKNGKAKTACPHTFVSAIQRISEKGQAKMKGTPARFRDRFAKIFVH